MDIQLILQYGFGGAALVMVWQLKQEIRNGFASVREVLGNHDRRLSTLEAERARSVGFSVGSGNQAG